jgi:hypothetical protein
MPKDEVTLQDQVSIEQDRRKLEKLINDGVISQQALQGAPIVQLESGPYKFDSDPSMAKIVSVLCGHCRAEFKTMEQFEAHLLNNHIA